jgi:hypothetical protein
VPERDEFSSTTRRQLAARAGYRCGFPRCGALTVGPSDEAPTASSSIGMACHIAAAAPGRGARRYVAGMTTEERSGIENGIWMCFSHGRLVDTDEGRFTLDMLRAWRIVAEARARVELEAGTLRAADLQDELVRLSFPTAVVRVNGIGEENLAIGTALDDCCVSMLWGEDVTDAIRDVIVETVRNGFRHGGARRATVTIEARVVRVVEDGNEFDLLSLLGRQGRGGAAAIAQLFEAHGARVVLATRRVADANETTIAFVRNPASVEAATPCTVRVERRGNLEVIANATAVSNCASIYVLLPPFLSVSDVYELRHRLAECLGERRVVLVVSRASVFVREQLALQFPHARVMSF